MTTRISMIPNNDVQVIHASQGDTEREWEFELYDNEGLIDTSSIGQQTVYPVYAGGTEEILPSALMNGVIILDNLTWYWNNRDTYGFWSSTLPNDVKLPSSPNYNPIQNALCIANGMNITFVGGYQIDGTENSIGKMGISASYTVNYNNGSTTEPPTGILYYESTNNTPGTSPMLADIQYPDQLRLEQYFTYRQCPTASDGKAKVKKLYGNSIVFNQLVRNGDFVDTSIWVKTGSSTTLSVSNNTMTINAPAQWGGIYQGENLVVGHKYALICTVKNTKNIVVGISQVGGEKAVSANANFTTKIYVETASGNYGNFVISSSVAEANEIQVKNVMLIDLTQMGLDSLTAQEFEALFSLPYYQYNTGTLLAFNGTDIKTTGFNQWDEETILGYYNSSGVWTVADNILSSKNYIAVIPNVDYYIGLTNSTAQIAVTYWDANKQFISRESNRQNTIITIPSNCYFILFNMNSNYGVTYNNNVCINISDPAKNGTYVPYEEHLTPLPISDYFPTGMKSAGTVYDELSESRAVTRIGSVDLGTLNWSLKNIANPYFYTTASIGHLANGLCISPKYAFVTSTEFATADKSVRLGGAESIQIRDTSYSDTTTFKNAMSGVMLFYELAEPSEESFLNVSFVSQNIETEMTADNGKLIAKSDGYTDNAGVFPCKIKVASDGVAYSSEFKLHVERKP